MGISLKAIRLEKGLSQKQVADSCEIAQATYCNIELGKKKPSVDLAKSLAQTLGIDWTRFYEDEADEKGG